MLVVGRVRRSMVFEFMTVRVPGVGQHFFCAPLRMNALPHEMYALVLSKLGGKNAARAATVSKRMHNTVRETHPGLPKGTAATSKYLSGTAPRAQQREFAGVVRKAAQVTRRARDAAEADPGDEAALERYHHAEDLTQFAKCAKKGLRRGSLVYDMMDWSSADPWPVIYAQDARALYRAIPSAQRRDPDALMSYVVKYVTSRSGMLNNSNTF